MLSLIKGHAPFSPRLKLEGRFQHDLPPEEGPTRGRARLSGKENL